MMLSAQALRARLWNTSRPSWQRIKLDPLDPSAVQGCSIDVHLGERLLVYDGVHMDTRSDTSDWWRELAPAMVVDERQLIAGPSGPSAPTAWILQPGRLYLGALAEYLEVPEDCCAQLDGVSTRARQGIVLHQQAGLLDPGWFGRATLELSVLLPHTILYAGQRIGQLTFQQLTERTDRPYQGRYQGDRSPQPARRLLETAP